MQSDLQLFVLTFLFLRSCSQAGTFSPVTHPGARTLLWLDTRALLQRTSRTGQSGGGRDATVVEAGVEAADLVVIAEALGE